MTFLNIVSFIIPPLIAVLLYLYLRFTLKLGSHTLLIQAFIWGMISIALVIIIQIFASYFGIDKLNNIRRIIFYALIIMAFFAEFGKFFFLKIFVYPRKEFQTPLDGVIFAVMISLGFAFMNNILYFISIPGLTVNTANAISAGPANVIFGVIMGFFIGLGKLRKMRFIDSMTGLAAAIFFHGLYDFCLLTKDYRLLWAFFIGATIIAISLCIAALRMHLDAREEEKH